MNNKHLASISIITNPAKNYLLLKSLIELSSEFYYTIIDLTGKEIVCEKVKSSYGKIVSISVDFLKSGMYLLKVMDGEDFIVRSFVKV